MKVCKVPGCDSVHYARGWCGLHYQRARRRQGEPTGVRECGQCSVPLPSEAHANQLFCRACSEARRAERNRVGNRAARARAKYEAPGAWRQELRQCVACGADFLRGDRSPAAVTCSDACSLERRRERMRGRVRRPQPRPVVEAQEEEVTDWARVMRRIAESSGPAAARRARDLLMAQRQRAGGSA